MINVNSLSTFLFKYVIVLKIFKGFIMKKLLFYILMLIPILSFAGLDINKVSNVLSSLKSTKPLKYFNESISLKHKFKANGSTIKFTSLKDADILLMSKINSSYDSSKLVITDSYEKLKNSNKRVIGAVYVKKERTHIFFVKERLENRGIHISNKMKKYLIPECYLNAICLLHL